MNVSHTLSLTHSHYHLSLSLSPVVGSLPLPQHLKKVLGEHRGHAVVVEQVGTGRRKRLRRVCVCVLEVGGEGSKCRVSDESVGWDLSKCNWGRQRGMYNAECFSSTFPDHPKRIFQTPPPLQPQSPPPILQAPQINTLTTYYLYLCTYLVKHVEGHLIRLGPIAAI